MMIGGFASMEVDLDDKFSECLKFILDEGYYSNLSEARIKTAWDESYAEMLPMPLCLLQVDAAMMVGVFTAFRTLQRAIKDKKQIKIILGERVYDQTKTIIKKWLKYCGKHGFNTKVVCSNYCDLMDDMYLRYGRMPDFKNDLDGWMKHGDRYREKCQQYYEDS